MLTIDGLIEAIIARLDEIGLDRLTSESESRRLRRVLKYLPEASELFVVDRVGNTVAAAPSGLQSSLINDVSGREWLRALRDEKVERYVGRALMGTIHGISFLVARAIRGPDGNFVGAVQVAGGVTFLANLFHSLND